ncbi:penicillin-binding protein [Streptomyces sp. IpFD-1.1]|uniref:penicillin-binding transpeptidase domain-containing protein n=1 Tax=Streptomyces sp. IpFD-1.1 TaxID=2841664 RepID=UPI0020956091|nr:penicillin-binding transpeptidase domain-containing protein [Streptomyces sp. IpFD-1.1]MCO6752402.1 penicillin-binding protein [Streptomyces sp. IpFD-1.1]
MRNGAKAALVGGVFLGMVGAAGFGVYELVGDVGGGGDGVEAAAAEKPAGPPTRAEAAKAAKAFFAAWSRRDTAEAAQLTDNAVAARTALTDYFEAAHVSHVRVTAEEPVGRTVGYAVEATVSVGEHRGTWKYEGELEVVRGETTGRPLVDWAPEVLHPDLQAGDTLQAGEAEVPPIRLVDRAGQELKRSEHPSLGPLLDKLRDRYGKQAGGRPGVELWIDPESSAPRQTLLTLAEGKPGTVRTTLSAAAQHAAEQAVAGRAEASVVALRPSTGEILAVADHRADGFDASFLGQLAPGSTMKIVSASLLIDKGLTAAEGAAPCPPSATWQSQTFNNLPGLAPNEHATLADSFARSCNTAFVKFADELKVDDLTRQAQEVFGLARDDWRIGVPSFDGRVPASGGPDTAAALIGQGQVQLNPLTLASVTATARTGAFRQPVLVPRELIDGELAQARGLAPGTAAQLRAMMHRTATSGSAAGALAGLGGDIGAKTGSAEVDGQATANSWFTAYRGDLAVAAVAEQGGRGGESAGPIVAAVLRSGA